ncbi:glycerate kinase [Pseudonocardia endophytica]|uniref:Glycerate kinase n=1 Tax=Pseudonocardia endophytica TaxID=401976 RepID=A0A4R1HWM8_PSEEN|nr:glycerate kinase [Pseudonocardia endophytica]TCK25871.1 glycerate kinase [Pseudonocardia endophytica]
MSAILVAPDKFKGSADAPTVADALAAGIADADPHREVRRLPVADGGEGTVAAALAAGWAPVTVDATGPTGRPLTVTYARRGPTALVELAAVAGLGALPDHAFRPLDATTHGLGTVLAHALDAGADEIVVGIGGSATTDGGAGLLTGLGARVLDADGRELPPGGAALARASRIDLSTLHPRAHEVPIVFACDVDNPLLGATGAAAVYGPQKGASPEQVAELDAALGRWASVLARTAGRDVADVPGAGAAGGTPCGAMAVLGASLRPGVETVLELVGFPAALRDAELVVTGEGCLDRQTLHGKAPVGVARAARAAGIPVVAVAGDCTLGDDELRAAGFAGVYTVAAIAPDRATALADAPALLRRIGAELVPVHTASRPSRVR